MKQTNLKSAVHQSAISNLWILTNGSISSNPAELLGSQAMEELLVDMYNPFDTIVFDTPPILPIADVHILANQCHGIVLVMKSGAGEKDAVLKAKDILDNAVGKFFGVVLNQKSSQKMNSISSIITKRSRNDK
ncbi:hypothetical protein H7K07_20825 [Priestia aryabhattai]|nr:hypothetical protein [Priestia aryabhattai]